MRRVLFGEGTPGTERWRNTAREALLAKRRYGMARAIDQARTNAVRAAQRSSLDELTGYLRPQLTA